MMNAVPQSFTVRNDLTAYFWSDDTLLSRSVSDIVLTNTLNIPLAPAWLLADWDREITTCLELAAGDVDSLSLSRARTRWPGYRTCVQRVMEWIQTIGLSDAFSSSDIALMACRGARYHHDGTQYGGKAFCNLFLSENNGLDLHFPHTGHRIPWVRGTVVLFDTAQPHGVVRRGSSRFDVADCSPAHEGPQFFLSWEIPIETADMGRVLGIRLDAHPSSMPYPDEEQVWKNGAPAVVCPDSGQWLTWDCSS